MAADLAELFGSAGPLARALPGYAVRDEQVAMAEHVAAAHGATVRSAAHAGRWGVHSR
jgi:Rad3-related DNA helicase